MRLQGYEGEDSAAEWDSARLRKSSTRTSVATAVRSDSDYRELRTAVATMGLLSPVYPYYLWRGILCYAILGTGFAVSFYEPSSCLSILVSSVMIGFGMVQIGQL